MKKLTIYTPEYILARYDWSKTARLMQMSYRVKWLFKHLNNQWTQNT